MRGLEGIDFLILFHLFLMFKLFKMFSFFVQEEFINVPLCEKFCQNCFLFKRFLTLIKMFVKVFFPFDLFKLLVACTESLPTIGVYNIFL